MRLKQAIKKALYAFKPTFVKVTVAQIQSGVTLKGKKIVITGGSRGLGRAMAEKFIAEGATVLITGKKPENLEKAKVEINSPLLYIKAFDAENIVDIPVFFDNNIPRDTHKRCIVIGHYCYRVILRKRKNLIGTIYDFMSISHSNSTVCCNSYSMPI